MNASLPLKNGLLLLLMASSNSLEAYSSMSSSGFSDKTYQGEICSKFTSNCSKWQDRVAFVTLLEGFSNPCPSVEDVIWPERKDLPFDGKLSNTGLRSMPTNSNLRRVQCASFDDSWRVFRHTSLAFQCAWYGFVFLPPEFSFYHSTIGLFKCS